MSKTLSYKWKSYDTNFSRIKILIFVGNMDIYILEKPSQILKFKKWYNIMLYSMWYFGGTLCPRRTNRCTHMCGSPSFDSNEIPCLCAHKNHAVRFKLNVQWFRLNIRFAAFHMNWLSWLPWLVSKCKQNTLMKF